LAKVAFAKMVDGDAQRNQQIHTGVADHGDAGDGNIREGRELQRAGEGRFHFKRRAAPDGFAGHDEAGNDANHGEARAFREPAHLFEPAAEKCDSEQAERDDAARERREPRAEQKRD
jgi:hypothetical protein